MDEILVDKNGYQQFLQELEKLEQQSLMNSINGSEVYEAAVGDGWHDNFAFEESMRESRSIASQIDKMHNDQKLLKIIEKTEYNDEVIEIGDTFKVKICYAEDDIEEETLTLTGKYIPDTNQEIKEITLNSPLGKAVYQKKINTINSYYVGENKIEVQILNKI